MKMPLTQQEKNFVDHLDYEAIEATSGRSALIPATRWMIAHQVTSTDIVNVLNIRRFERGTPEVKEPTEPYAPAWETAEKARERNSELEEELQLIMRSLKR